MTSDGGRRLLLLIDVDGVLNPFVPGGVVPVGFDEHRIDGMRVLLTPRHGEWLRSLATDFDLVWASTWESDANRHIGAVLGLPPLPHIVFRAPEAWAQEWTRKLPGVDAFARDRPLAWIDDRFGAEERQWAHDRTAGGIPTLLVETDGSVGLTQGDVSIIRAFGSRAGGADE